MNKLLIILLAFGMISGNILRFQFQNGVAITFLDFAVGLVFLKTTFELVKNKKYKILPFEKAFLLFIVISLLSLVLNSYLLNIQQLGIASLYLLRYAIYGSVYIFFRTLSKKDIKFAILLTLFIGAGFVGIGYIQYFFYSNLRNLYYLGWDEHLYRMFSTFLDPNFAGAFFVLFEVFLASFFIQPDLKKKRTIYFGIIILSVLTFFAIILTYSRSAFLMLCVALITTLFLSKYKRIIFFILLFSFGALWIFSNTLIESKNPFRLASSSARLESAKNAITIISHDPVFGVGFNAYRYAQERFGLRDEHTQFVSHADSGTDSSILFVTATTGIVGLVIFCNFLFTVLKRSYLLFKLEKKTLAGVFFVSFSALFIDSTFINSLFYPIILTWIWMMAGFMENR